MSRTPALIRTLVWCLALTVVVSFSSACTPRTRSLPAPAEAVSRLLELRARNSTDPAAYRRYIETTSLAEALAADSASRTADSAPTPEWSTPEVTRQTTSTAEVKVAWKRSARFKKWPSATVFTLRLIEGSWRVADAVDATATVK